MTRTTSDNRTDGYAGVLPAGLVRCADGLVRTADGYGRIVPEWRLDRSVPVPEPDRATRVASWVGWRFWELAGVTVPAAVAVAVTPWAWLVSGAVGVGWAVHEFRTATEQAPLKAELAARHTTTGPGAHVSDVDETDGALDGPAPDTDSTEDSAAPVGTEVAGGAA